MQSFLGGDKGGSSNPLKQIGQREGADHSLFKDRYSPAGPSSSQSSSSAFRPPPQITHHPPPSASSAALHSTPHPFNLSHLSAALSQPSPQIGLLQHHQPAPIASPQFNAQWEQARSNGHSPVPQNVIQARAPQESAWSGDFQSFHGKGKGRAVEQPSSPQGSSPYQNGYSSFTPHYGGGFQPSFQPMYQGMIPHQQIQQTQGQAPRALDQKEMDDLFARAEEDYRASSSEAQVDKVQEQDQEQGQDGVEEMTSDPKGDLEKVWESLKPEAERLNQLAEWEKDFSQFTNDEDDLFDTLNESLNRSDVGQRPLEQQMHIDRDVGELAVPDGLDQYNGVQRDDGIPQNRGYDYASNNIHDSSELAVLWAEANRIVTDGGSLTQAGLMLESFVRRSTAQDRQQLNVSATEAWSLLGRVHAMDEKEEPAMRAFEEGRKTLGEEGVRGKESVAGEMLTNLAISYVNESLDLAALTVLHQYLSLVHPTHAGQAPSRSSLGDNNSPWALHESMAERFLNLAREQWQNTQSVDPNVQVGLGTLYYMMDNYEEARGCWTNALGEKPDDYLLWNRLGATLANGGNSEEAVDAYRRALELKPTFTRAIFNLGVACLNIGVYKESAEHLLAALSLHSNQSQSDPDRDSDILSSDSWSIWSTLRRALVALHMNQLAGNAEPGADLNIFRQAGFDF
ncbi:hypothetical protein V866_004246 [Kwoniella sp. B9012]